MAEPEALGNNAFATAWYAGSLVIALPTARTMLALIGFTDVTFHTAIDFADNTALAVALGSLMYYLLYLVTGRHGVWRLVIVAYACYLVYQDWFTLRLGARTLVVGPWQAELLSQNNPSAFASMVFGVLLAIPMLFMVGTYGVLALRTQDRSQRYRIAMITSGFLLLFSVVLVAYLLHLDVEPWFALTYEVPGLVTALLVVGAYRPPRWVQRWLNVTPPR